MTRRTSPYFSGFGNLQQVASCAFLAASAFIFSALLAPVNAGAVVGDPSVLLESGGGRYDPPADEIDPIVRSELLRGAREVSARLGLNGSVKENDGKRRATPKTNLSSSASANGAIKLRWPVRPADTNRHDFQSGISNYVDLDESTGSLLDYACGQRTYDRNNGYNHEGVDISSWPYPWITMDNNGLDVVAAADGTIVSKVGSRADKSCSFSSSSDWNVIVLAHSDGKQTVYGHLKRDSLTEKRIGDFVSAGEFLGQVGSSGISTGPHLHFELLNRSGENLDPFAGECGANESHWRWQPEYNRPRVNAVLTGDGAPEIGDCYGSEQPKLSNQFAPGDPVFVTGFFINQARDNAARLELIAPDGSIWLDVAMGNPSESYNFSYWYRSFIAPSITGHWRARISLNGESSESGFFVGEPSREGLLVAAVLPGSRSVGLNQSASIFATIANGGQVPLWGCRVLPLGPFSGQLTFQATDAVTNQLVGSPNQPFSIAVGGAQSLALTLQPNAEVVPSNIEFNFKCNNAPRARSVRGLNTLQFSAASSAPADILPVSATADGDGVVRLKGTGGAAAFGTAAINIGSSVSDVTVVPVANGLDLSLSVCETDADGSCKASPSGEVAADFARSARTFSVFIGGNGSPIVFDPENNRIELRFESGGEIRGFTSVAVTTD